jgi:hypothetical protein
MTPPQPPRDAVKPLYTIGELAQMFGRHRNSTLRLLEAAGVEFTMAGKRRYVALKEIEDRLPKVWRSVFLARDVADSLPD